MITYIAHMRVRRENSDAYKALIDEMAANVQAHEPGVVFYESFISDSDPEAWVVIEVYRDEAAFKAHWETDYIRPSVERTKPLIEEGSLEIRRYVSP
ncbi:MAG: antibiotic biosynthesis monooxygenase [Novosphingobium sp.]|nr:antibiotic biosynthesis monooxygenase [Novosphingobium sp.]MCP5404384.1 antibiotic biosynthesis monooxygenase [Novosphingobium sp.]